MVAMPLIVHNRVAKKAAKEKKGATDIAKSMDPFTRFWMNFMTEYRGVVMVMVVVPMSFIMETYFETRDWFYRNFLVSPKLHDQRVRKVQVRRMRRRSREDCWEDESCHCHYYYYCDYYYPNPPMPNAL